MMEVYTLDQAEKWDAVVRFFKEYDVYWLSGYVKAFQIHGDGDPLLFFYEGNDCRGINVVMKRDVAKDKRFIGRLRKEGILISLLPMAMADGLLRVRRQKSCLKNMVIGFRRIWFYFIGPALGFIGQ